MPNPPKSPLSTLISRTQFLRLAVTTMAGLLLGTTVRRARAQAQPVRLLAPTRPWQSAEFSYALAQDLPGQVLPGIVIRLPETSGGGLYACCRICPHQGCIFDYESDYDEVSNIIGLDLDHPVLFCRCHFSTYDPLQDGNVIYGPAPRPPWRFTVQEDAGEITVTDVEPGVGG